MTSTSNDKVTQGSDAKRRGHASVAWHSGIEDNPPNQAGGIQVRVALLYFEACPSWEIAHTRLTEALGSTGRDDIAVDLRLVETPEAATKLKFIGSPSIRIDGADPFATGDEPVGLACRLYDTPDGRAGAPTAAQLVEVLSSTRPIRRGTRTGAARGRGLY